jgi:polysaccharide biosynthesis protein PslH
MQNQVEYYRNRGYLTVFICVPIHCSFTETHPDWDDLKTGIRELGADHTFFAAIDNRKFTIAKYTAWVAHLFRGTALDWIVFTAKSAQLPADAVQFIHELPVTLVHANHVFTLDFARRLLRGTIRSGHRVPVILDSHDIQSNALEERGEINPWTHRFDKLERLVDSEIAHLNKVKVLVHLSLDDFNFFKLRLPDKQHVLAMPTIDETFVSSVRATRHSPLDPIDLLFVGQRTTPNFEAMRWFFEKVWPLIAHCGYRIKIVGAIDVLVREELPELYREFRSYFVGPTPELAPYYSAARCVIAPMVSGTGISIKTIEALALGKPFVGTSKAYRGMPMDRIEQAGMRAHDTPIDFAEAIKQALLAEQRASAASRAAYDSLFSNQASFSARDEALKIAVAT